MTEKLTASVYEKAWSAYRASQSRSAARSRSRVLRTTTFGGSSTVRTNASAGDRPTRRRSSAWVSATTKLVVTRRRCVPMAARSAAASRAWSGCAETMSGYHALVSTKNSAGTPLRGGSLGAATRTARCWPSPGCLLGVGEHRVVIACGVRCVHPGRLGVGNPDEPERGMCGRGQQLSFERQQSSSYHVRLAGVELIGETLQPLPFVGDEVDLEGGSLAYASSCHDPPS